MSLREYVRKRSFEKTPEPPPGKAPASPGNRYFIQRHHATRLHYDFRLEMDGVLVSWAIPKGPSLTAGTKQLAVHVEDHPLDYGTFEGNIPKGNYGAGSVMLWDRGTYEMKGDLTPKEQLERGDFKFSLNGEKLSGEFALVLHPLLAPPDDSAEGERVLRLLLGELPLKSAVRLAAEISGAPRNALYELALRLRED